MGIDDFYQELKEKADDELMRIYGNCVVNGAKKDQEYFKIAAVNTLLQERGIEPASLMISMSFMMPNGKKTVVPIADI